MTAHICALHRAAMELVPAEPRSRCPNCHYMTHHLRFEHCPECGRRMQIEQPDPTWRCPICSARTEGEVRAAGQPEELLGR